MLKLAFHIGRARALADVGLSKFSALPEDLEALYRERTPVGQGAAIGGLAGTGIGALSGLLARAKGGPPRATLMATLLGLLAGTGAGAGAGALYRKLSE